MLLLDYAVLDKEGRTVKVRSSLKEAYIQSIERLDRIDHYLEQIGRYFSHDYD